MGKEMKIWRFFLVGRVEQLTFIQNSGANFSVEKTDGITEDQIVLANLKRKDWWKRGLEVVLSLEKVM